MSFVERGIAIGLIASFFTLMSCAPAASTQLPGEREEQTQEGVEPPPPPPSAEDQKDLEAFYEPELTAAAEDEILSAYSNLDPNHIVPTGLLKKAVVYFNANKAHIPNKDFLSIVDFSKNSSRARFYIVNMRTGDVNAIHVAHGKNSDKNDDGNATSFSNSDGSEMSSLGYYRTAETYSGAHGLSLRLDGLSSTNSHVRSRAIVLHGADYVYDSTKKPGRSWGCLAVSMDYRSKVVSALKGGSIIYAALAN